MRLSLVKYTRGWFYLLLLLTGCNLEKEIEVELPPYESQLVVECYLEPGQPYRLTLLESSSFLDQPELKLIQDATITISRNGVPETLQFTPTQDTVSGKYYTHTSPKLVEGQPGDVFTLAVTDTRGRSLAGSATWLPVVPIDTVEFKFNDKAEALTIARFKDNGQTKDFYRFAVHKDSLLGEAEVDYTSPDELNNGEPFVFGTGYDFAPGDTVFVTLHHLEEAFFDFQESVEEAKSANGNPFAQPARVKSTVQGGLGVFATIIYDRKMLVVPEK